MQSIHEELLKIADQLKNLSARKSDEKSKTPLAELEKAAERVGKAWSGSWLGYQAYVYYGDFKQPPPGAHFSMEWGFQELHTIPCTRGDWREYNPDQIEKLIYELAGNPSIEYAIQLSEKTKKEFEKLKSDVLSILTTSLDDHNDSFLTRLKDDADKISALSKSQIIRGMQPSGEFFTRDAIALSKGYCVPPHLDILSLTIGIRQVYDASEKLSEISLKAGSHLSRKKAKMKKSERIGTNVFIGHGRSLIWKDLKDFIQDRLALPWDEFNRVPVAGFTNIARLSEMLDSAAIAFLIMTGEDEQTDGKVHARMNVVHESGLFQGRLGFSRAIILLEDGCEEFSNIHGLGQIRFPKGNIKASFEEIRQVIEREGIIESNI